MFKRILLSLSVISTLSFAEQVNVSLPDAVTLNHKLIKDLYGKIEAMEKRITELENKSYTSKSSEKQNLTESNSKEIKEKYSANDKNIYFVSYSNGFIRDKPNSSGVTGEVKFGDTVKCETISNDWCKIDEDRYIYAKVLSKFKKDIIVITKNTNAKAPKTEKIYGETIPKGTVLGIKGAIKDKWFVTEDNLLIDKNSATKSK